MYEKFYNLTSKPFRLTPDSRFFYASRSHKRAMAYLMYGVKQGEGFIVITGDVGTGKTTLVQNLLSLLKSEDVVAAQIVSTQIQEDDLIRLVASSFGLKVENQEKATLLRDLEFYFKACYSEGKRALLVIDESQNLPPKSIEELRMLSNFQISGNSLVQSFLLGQKEFRTTMRSAGFEQLRQRVIAAYHLRPLDEEEVRGYIRYRLKKASWKDDPHLSEEAYRDIFEFTEGIPRRINMFCDRVMLYAYLEEMHQIDHDVISTVARDVVEEQGGLINESGNLPKLDIASASEGLNILRDPVAEPVVTLNGEHEERLGQVEQSVSALSEAMREELSMLRQALAEFKGKSKE